MKYKTVEGYTLEYERWHVGIDARMNINTPDDSWYLAHVGTDNIQKWITGLRTGSATIREHNGSTRISLFGDNLHFNCSSTGAKLIFNLDRDTANTIADDLEELRNDPARIQSEQMTKQIHEEWLSRHNELPQKGILGRFKDWFSN